MLKRWMLWTAGIGLAYASLMALTWAGLLIHP